MPSLSNKNGVFHARFWYAGRQYRRTLKTNSPREAEGALYTIKSLLCRLETGALDIPPGVDPGDFIASGGTFRVSPQRTRPTEKNVVTVRQLFKEYLASRVSKAITTIGTETTHLNHLGKSLRGKLDRPCDQVDSSDLEKYIQKRLQHVAQDTVVKEQATIFQVFRYAQEKKYIADSPAAVLPRLKTSRRSEPFRTVTEIEAHIARGGLTKREIGRLWSRVYLTPPEIASLLALVRERAAEDFTHLLHAIPAYTGMRRGEVMRLRWTDVDLERGMLTARSRKQSRQQTEVCRTIDIHPELQQILSEWRAQRPRGQFVVGYKNDKQPLDSNSANRCFYKPLLGTTWCLDASRRKFKIGFHCYRHSFVSNLAAAGVDQRIVDEFSGHQIDEMRRRYRHLFPKNRQAAIQAFSFQSSLGAVADTT
jgi:integrase